MLVLISIVWVMLVIAACTVSIWVQALGAQTAADKEL